MDNPSVLLDKAEKGGTEGEGQVIWERAHDEKKDRAREEIMCDHEPEADPNRRNGKETITWELWEISP